MGLRLESTLSGVLNAAFVPAVASQLAPLSRTVLATLTYTGRRSGARFSTPVVYRLRGDIVPIKVDAPGTKQWWRNFLGTARP